jgi:hypothetical protein
MPNVLKFGALTAACAAAAMLVPSTEASAGVMSVAGKETVSQSSLVDQVHWRRYCHRHWRYGWHYGWHRHYVYYPAWRYRYVYYPWRYRYSYYPYYYNPGAAVAGAAVGLATAPLWGWGGYPYYW